MCHLWKNRTGTYRGFYKSGGDLWLLGVVVLVEVDGVVDADGQTDGDPHRHQHPPHIRPVHYYPPFSSLRLLFLATVAGPTGARLIAVVAVLVTFVTRPCHLL